MTARCKTLLARRLRVRYGCAGVSNRKSAGRSALPGFRLRRFQQVGEILVELRQLRRNHKLAVRQRGIVAKIFAMVILRFVKRLKRTHLGDDRIASGIRCVQFPNEGLGLALLLIRRIEDHRAIFGTHVRPLAIEAGRIVRSKEHRQQIAIRYARGIVFDAHYFSVTGPAGAYLAIGRILEGASREARQHRYHAVELLEHRLGAPETSPTEYGYLFSLIHTVLATSMALPPSTRSAWIVKDFSGQRLHRPICQF